MTTTSKRIAKILAMGLVFSWAVAGCQSVPPQVTDTIRIADNQYEAGDVDGALKGYTSIRDAAREYELENRPTIEVRIGKCQLDLGQAEQATRHFEEVDGEVSKGTLQLSPDLAYQKHIAHGEALCEQGRRTEPLTSGSSGIEKLDAQDQRKRALERYNQARMLFDRALAVNAGYEAKMGLAYAFMQKGVLDSSESALTQAKRFLGECRSAPEAAQDPRVPFYDAKITQWLSSKGQLTDVSLRSYLAACDLDRKERTFGYHELYRDLYRLVHPYPTPDDVVRLDPESRGRLERVYQVLDDYIQSGRRPLPAWNEWVVAREDLEKHYRNYRDWISKDRRRDVLVAEARALIRGQGDGGTVGIESYRRALRKLDEVDPRFRGALPYIEARKEAQKPCIERLIKQGEVLRGIGKFDLARASLQEALALCDGAYVAENTEVLSRCNEARERVNVEESWAAIAAQARELAQKSEDEAVKFLEDNTRPDMVAVIGDQRIAALRDELSNRDLLRVQALLAEGKALEKSAPSEALNKYDAAWQQAIASNVDDSLKEDLVRHKCRALYLIDDYQRCLDQLGDREADPRDRILKALCWAKKGDFAQSKKMFKDKEGKDIDPKLLGQTVGGNDSVQIAGMVYLQAGDAWGARLYLEEAAEKKPSDRELSEARQRCYRALLAEKKLQKSEERDTLEKLAALQGATLTQEERRRFAVLLYEEGVAEQRREFFERAYQQLSQDLKGANLIATLTPEERTMYAKLVATFADYAPVRVGATWEYKSQDGLTPRYKVTGGAGDRYTVVLEINNKSTPQEWQKLPNSRELERKEEGTREILPLGLLNPEQSAQDRSVPQALAKRPYIARLVAIGVPVTAGGVRYENCLHVQVKEEGHTEAVDYFFAPNVGQVRYKNSATGAEWELTNSTIWDAT